MLTAGTASVPIYPLFRTYCEDIALLQCAPLDNIIFRCLIRFRIVKKKEGLHPSLTRRGGGGRRNPRGCRNTAAPFLHQIHTQVSEHIIRRNSVFAGLRLTVGEFAYVHIWSRFVSTNNSAARAWTKMAVQIASHKTHRSSSKVWPECSPERNISAIIPVYSPSTVTPRLRAISRGL